MRYVTVLADYQGTGLKDDFQGIIEPASLGLPNELILRLSEWVALYQPIIPRGIEARKNSSQEIERFDEVGLAIARDVSAHLGQSAKVRYYSEGKLREIAL